MTEDKTVRIACEGAAVMPIDHLLDFQGNLKDLSAENYGKLKKEILELGFSEPVSVWREKSEHGFKLHLLNGHQRTRTLRQMRDKEGYVVPPIPVSWVEADDLKQAKKKVLALTSQYGELTTAGLHEFMHDAGLSFEEVEASFRFPEIEFPKFEEEFFTDPNNVPIDESLYTNKIKSPIYEIKGEKPKLSDLLDLSKTNSLIDEIDKSDTPEEIKEFLRAAARRHVVFDYQNIAEFYAHADKETQLLMERSALVIIDFKQAVENGFVALSKKIADEYTSNGTDGE